MKSGVRWWTNSIVRELRDSERLYGLRQLKAKSDGVGFGQGPFSREGAHPQLFRFMFKDKLGGYTSPLKWLTRLVLFVVFSFGFSFCL
jgi:hypothetical protein